MPDALTLLLAFVASVAGLAWLALAMDTHWAQVCGAAPQRRATVLALRVLGTAAIGLSLVLCLRVDHASMAALVWVMGLAASALTVAFTLAWRPGLLAPLVLARPRTAGR